MIVNSWGKTIFLKNFLITSFGVFEVFSEDLVGLNRASVKSKRHKAFTVKHSNVTLGKRLLANGKRHRGKQVNKHSGGVCSSGFPAFELKTMREPRTCKGSGDVILDLYVDKESRQSQRHVALTAEADMMETCEHRKVSTATLVGPYGDIAMGTKTMIFFGLYHSLTNK